ncbi:hypothetical protein D3C76_809750 [compost metagenome]
MVTSLGIFSRTCSLTVRFCTCWLMDSVKRAAALPVGAARRMRKGLPASTAGACSKASKRTTVVVLPVPGPPVTMLKAPRVASAQASFCQSIRPASRVGNSWSRRIDKSAGTVSAVTRRSRRALSMRRSKPQ